MSKLPMNVINPEESDWKPEVYDLCFGAYGETRVSVHAKGVEDALETAAEWLAEHAPGIFTEPDYEGAARDAGYSSMADCARDLGPEGDYTRISSAAEADLTYTESGWIPSWEWSVDGPRQKE